METNRIKCMDCSGMENNVFGFKYINTLIEDN